MVSILQRDEISRRFRKTSWRKHYKIGRYNKYKVGLCNTRTLLMSAVWGLLRSRRSLRLSFSVELVKLPIKLRYSQSEICFGGSITRRHDCHPSLSTSSKVFIDFEVYFDSKYFCFRLFVSLWSLSREIEHLRDNNNSNRKKISTKTNYFSGNHHHIFKGYMMLLFCLVNYAKF